MAQVRDCIEFDRLWNDQLDVGPVAVEPGPRDRAMAEHSAGCDRCRGRELAFAELEAALLTPASVPPAPPEAIARWVAAASAARPRPARVPLAAPPAEGARRRRDIGGIALRLGRTVALAASTLVGSTFALPILYPIGADRPERTESVATSPFEEACAEATTMAQNLVVEVSAPASQLGAGPLDLVQAGPPPFEPTQYQPAAASIQQEADPIEPARVELISGSTRQAFRFLTGSTTDEQEDPALIEGL